MRKPTLSRRVVSESASRHGLRSRRGRVIPCAAANHAHSLATAIEPRGAVVRRAMVARMPRVRAPFADVAMHGLEPEGIRRECSRRSARAASDAEAVLVVEEVRFGGRDLDARVKWSARAGAAGVFHSASLGRRTRSPVLAASHAQ